MHMWPGVGLWDLRAESAQSPTDHDACSTDVYLMGVLKGRDNKIWCFAFLL